MLVHVSERSMDQQRATERRISVTQPSKFGGAVHFTPEGPSRAYVCAAFIREIAIG